MLCGSLYGKEVWRRMDTRVCMTESLCCEPETITIVNRLSDQISRSVVSNSLRPHESQHARPPCPSPTPGAHPDSRPAKKPFPVRAFPLPLALTHLPLLHAAVFTVWAIKSSLGKFKKIEIIPSIFSHHNAVRLNVNYRRITIKNSNIWRLNNTLLNNQQITEEIKICIEMNKNENTTTQNVWDTVKAVPRARFIALQDYLKK